MDPTVLVALIGAASVVTAALLARPSRQTHRAVKRIEDEFSTNGGTTARDAINRIEASQHRLTGRLDQHLDDSRTEKELAHKEAIRMWTAIESIAAATPPKESR